MTAAIGDIWYRYVSSHYTAEGAAEPRISIHLEQWHVIKVMPASVRLSFYHQERTVLKEARKRFAYPTKELAFNSFVHRSRWRLMHAEMAHLVANSVYKYARRLAEVKQLPNDIDNIAVETPS